MIGDNPQDATLAKEEAKIRRRRADNEARRSRILNARARTMGLDVRALDAQVEEKMNRKMSDRVMENLEKAQAIEIERMLAAADEEIKQMQEYQKNEIRKSWEASIKEKEDMKRRPMEPDFDPENAGRASCQAMPGEDKDRDARIRAQKAQMNRWIQEKIAENDYLKRLDREDDMTYAEMLKTIDEIREATEKEEEDLRRFVRESFRKENDELARYRKDLRTQENDRENALGTTLDLFNEDKKVAIDEYGRVIRKDMFKGFTEEQKRTILQHNQSIMRHKIASKNREQEEDRMWMIQDRMAARAMEQAEYEENQIRAAMKEDQLAYLRQQIDEAKRVRAEWDTARFGSVEPGFFENFGTSCR